MKHLIASLTLALIIPLLNGCGNDPEPPSETNYSQQDPAEAAKERAEYLKRAYTPSKEEIEESNLLLEKEIREDLGKPFSAGPLTQADFNRFDSFLYFDKELHDITLISKMRNLRALHIKVSEKCDLSAIFKLSNLMVLNLSGTVQGRGFEKISEIFPHTPNLFMLDLAGCKSFLASNSVSHLSSLPPKLGVLVLPGHRIQDFSALQGKSLTNLDLGIVKFMEKWPDINKLPALENISISNPTDHEIAIIKFKKTMTRNIDVGRFQSISSVDISIRLGIQGVRR